MLMNDVAMNITCNSFIDITTMFVCKDDLFVHSVDMNIVTISNLFYRLYPLPNTKQVWCL